MKHIKKAFFFFTTLLVGLNSTSIFSFNTSLDLQKPAQSKELSTNIPANGAKYLPWIAQNGAFIFPHLPYSERSKMVQRRQWQMNRRNDAMTALAVMINGKSGFDREKAINYARSIQDSSAQALTYNFHPSALNTFDSKATLNMSANYRAFNANALALYQAATALVKELEKQPTVEKGALLLPKSSNPFVSAYKDKVAVSPKIWDKFNSLSAVCNSCHQSFRRLN